MFAITQFEYYTNILKFTAIFTGATLGVVLFFLTIYLIVFYSHYWK